MSGKVWGTDRPRYPPAASVGSPAISGYFLLTAGILPYALRASFAVRRRSCGGVGQQRESDPGAGRRTERPLRKRPGRRTATRRTKPPG